MPAQAVSHEVSQDIREAHKRPLKSDQPISEEPGSIPPTPYYPAPRSTPPTLRETVQMSIRHYLEDMGTCQAEDLYQILLSEVEPPLIEEVLRFTNYNQSRAARILGITRNTLRSKILRYDISVTDGKFGRL